ncbi:aminoglycoside phosphotransferase family protein [Kutzneria sp. NPDC051319]|uniref:phosphotransferase enzyme family protein n=1 Tax=Kutzneria sp. NPDC051319 TaxID=3155047 RepID=UPI0034339B15
MSSQPFGAESSRDVLNEACRSVGLHAGNTELLRLGENAIYHLLGTDIVVRIARTMDYWTDAVKEVSVAKWLEHEAFPAARVTNHDQPLSIAGHPVTFWKFIEGRRGGPSDICSLATILRQLHGLQLPTAVTLPEGTILERVERRIVNSQVNDADKAFLSTRLDELRNAVVELEFPLPKAPTHGDAHVQNLMITGQGAAIIDFERFGWEHPEWDLSMTATEYVTAGWWTDAQYGQFVAAYGYDVTEWSGFDVLRQVHEIKMTTWLMQNVAESPEIAAEYEHRMHSIRTGSAAGSWKPF